MTDQEIDALIEKANAGSGYMALLKHSECREYARMVAAAERERIALALEADTLTERQSIAHLCDGLPTCRFAAIARKA